MNGKTSNAFSDFVQNRNQQQNICICGQCFGIFTDRTDQDGQESGSRGRGKVMQKMAADCNETRVTARSLQGHCKAFLPTWATFRVSEQVTHKPRVWQQHFMLSTNYKRLQMIETNLTPYMSPAWYNPTFETKIKQKHKHLPNASKKTMKLNYASSWYENPKQINE